MGRARPIFIKGNKVEPKMAKAQNITANCVFKNISKNGVFYVADSVGAGKSYIALATALGRWRARKDKQQRLFKILIIAPTSELCGSWLSKLGGKFREGKDRVSELGLIPKADSFFDLYLDEYKSKNPPEIAIYHFRGKHDVDWFMDLLEQSQVKDLKPKRNPSKNRIEILVTTPGWLNKGRRGFSRHKKSQSLFWGDWLRSVDIIIADEVFGARNRTQYGKLLRPNLDLRNLNIWNGRRVRPWLIGLSATLLSRDITDAWALFELAWAWKDKSYDFDDPKIHPYNGLKDDLDDFQKALKEGLVADNPSAHVKNYKEKKRQLEKKLKSLIVRTQPWPKRLHKFWAAGTEKIKVGKTSKTFPVGQGIQGIIDCLSNGMEDDPVAIKNLANFIKLGMTKEGLFDSKNITVPPSWTKILEFGDSITSPKHESFKSWIKLHYAKAEKDWLKRDLAESFRFKVLVYVHHVDTAKGFKIRRQELLGEFGKNFYKWLREAMLGTCWKISKQNKDLFYEGSLDKPRIELQEILGELHTSIQNLKKAQHLTLLLAALVHGNKGRNRTEKLSKIRLTIEGNILGAQKNLYIRLLTKFLEERKMILKKFDADSLIKFDLQRENQRRKMPSLSLNILDAEFAPIEEKEKAELMAKLNRIAEEIYKIVGLKATNKDMIKAKRKFSELRDILHDAISSSKEWRERINSFLKNPEKYSLRLQTKMKVNRRHHAPHELEVLTGQDLERRDHVTQKFLTPGNPFLLVLTNICTVGVDLHQFCWDVIHYTPSWTPHELEQKTGRIDRPRVGLEKIFNIGKNPNHIRVHHLIWPNTYDERMLSRVHLRSQYSERLLGSKTQDSLEEKHKSINSEMIELFRPLDISPKK
jgi:hypothetical protein